MDSSRRAETAGATAAAANSGASVRRATGPSVWAALTRKNEPTRNASDSAGSNRGECRWRGRESVAATEAQRVVTRNLQPESMAWKQDKKAGLGTSSRKIKQRLRV